MKSARTVLALVGAAIVAKLADDEESYARACRAEARRADQRAERIRGIADTLLSPLMGDDEEKPGEDPDPFAGLGLEEEDQDQGPKVQTVTVSHEGANGAGKAPVQVHITPP